MLRHMGRGLWMLVLLACAVTSPGRDSLFGRRATAQDLAPAPEQAEPQPKPAQPTQPAEAPGEAADAKVGGGNDKPAPEEKPAEKDEGVVIKPVKLDAGIEVKERKDFSLSRIDKPLAHETSANFQAAWWHFRAQNQLVDDGSGRKVFRRIPQPVMPGYPDADPKGSAISGSPLAVVLLEQDLGEGRWLAQAKWSNHGMGDWCPPGDNADKVIVLLAEGEGRVIGDRRQLVGVNFVHVGLVEARFDCKVPPADGKRITIRRHAFLAQPSLPDDDATRTAFQEAVAEGRYPAQVVVFQLRDCKVCGGVGYLRRSVPGRIQDERDPCTGGCSGGEKWVPVLLTFKP